MRLSGKSVEILDDDIFPEIKTMLKEAVAQEEIYLVTPFIHFDEKIRESMKEAVDRGVKVVLLVQKGADRNEKDSKFLADSHIKVHELEKLHAKICWCKDVVLITSMNLYDSSDRNNKEICVGLGDRKHVERVREIISNWMKRAEEVLPTALMPRSTAVAPQKPLSKRSDSQTPLGFCIHCRTPREFDHDKPYCENCGREWIKAGKNRNQVEKYCHRCGDSWQTTINSPFCDKHK